MIKIVSIFLICHNILNKNEYCNVPIQNYLYVIYEVQLKSQ